MNLDQFRARTLVVTVKELCPCCNVLKEGVETRYGIGAPFKSCKPCFNAGTHRALAPDEDYYAW